MQWIKFYVLPCECLYISRLTMFALVWFRKREKIVVQFCSIIIIGGVGIWMTMYKLDNMYGDGCVINQYVWVMSPILGQGK